MTGPTSAPRPLGPRDVLGIPLLPPAAAARSATRGRGLLARLHRALAPPPSRIIESALAGLEPAVLAALCRLGIPDRLARAVPIEELATALEVDPDRLGRLLGFAHVRGFVRLDRRGRVRPTRLTTFLRSDHPGGWGAWPMFVASDEVVAALGALHEGLTVGTDAFTVANDRPFFPFMAAYPEAGARFDAAMAAGAAMHGLLLARAFDWSHRSRLCDIGGGDGTLLATLIAHHPHLEGVVLELPEVVARVPERHGIVVEAGDAFDAVPPGFDTYLLVNVLHDWDDEAATRLLARAADAARAPSPRGSDARVIVLDSGARARPTDDITLLADTLMLALTPGGRERTVDEFTDLARAAGLHLHDHRTLASGDVALVFTPASPEERAGRPASVGSGRDPGRPTSSGHGAGADEGLGRAPVAEPASPDAADGPSRL
jgi:hypothetical protein